MRKLAAVAVFILGAAAIMGAGRGGTYQGGSYATSGASYQAGGAPAGWDTVVTLFSPEARVTTAIDLDNYPENPSGIDTFAISTSTPVTADTTRIVDLNSRLLGRDGTKYSFRDGPSDSAKCYKLGASGITSFAYGNIANYGVSAADTTGYRSAAADRIQLYCMTSNLYDGGRYLDMNYPVTKRFSELVYIPFQDYIPANSHIVSADINVSIVAGAPVSTSDTLIVSLMDKAGWDKWWLVKDVSTWDYYAHASWNLQQSQGPADAWGGTDAYPWVPDLDYCPKHWDVGAIADWTGNTTASIAAKAQFAIAATRCVQAIVNGSVNNGLMLNLQDLNIGDSSFLHYTWDTGTNQAKRMPYVVVKYITKRYSPPLGTSEWAFVASTDDGKWEVNDAATDTFLAHGGKYTVFIARQQLISEGSTTVSTPEQIVGFHTRGMEVGSHSLKHIPPMGLSDYHDAGRFDGMVMYNSAAWDSLVEDADPAWMYAMADTIVGDLRASPSFGKSIALPNGGWSPEVTKACVEAGYKAIRTTSSGKTVDREKVYELSTHGAARGDTANIDGPYRWARLRPQNVRLVGPNMEIVTTVGRADNAQITEAELDSVRQNMRRYIYSTLARGSNVASIFWHDVKSSTLYSQGIEGPELGAMLDVVDEFGGRYMGMAEYGDWVMAGGTPIDTPPTFAQADSMKYEAADRVWFKPDGVDNRWIRGVR